MQIDYLQFYTFIFSLQTHVVQDVEVRQMIHELNETQL